MRVMCDGSCSKCGRCRRLYLCDDLDSVKNSWHAKYLDQTAFRSEAIARADRDRQTDSHTQTTDCST